MEPSYKMMGNCQSRSHLEQKACEASDLKK